MVGVLADRFVANGVGPSVFFWVGALYINIEKNNPGKKSAF